MELEYGVIRNGEKYKIFKIKHVDYSLDVRRTHPIKQTKVTRVMEVQNRVNTWRLFVFISELIHYVEDTRLTYKVHMWSMNRGRSWDKKCVEIANN